MKEAANAYVGRQDIQSSRIGVVSFNSESRVESPLTRDATSLTNAINGLGAFGSTRMDLGISEAFSMLETAANVPIGQATSKVPERRNILLFTDGYPDSKSPQGDPAARALSFAQSARQRGMRIVAVGTDDADQNFLVQVTGDPTLVFRASDGQFGEAFRQAEIALNGPTGRALIQSKKVDNFDAALEMTRVSVWTALLGLGIATALLVSQLYYARQRFGASQLLGIAAGVLAGLVAGCLGQWLFVQAGDQSLAVAFGRLLAWAMGGTLLGLGLAPFVPNLAPLRAGLGGALGGWVGAMGFTTVAHFANDTAGRILGAAIIGFAIGLMVVLAEVAFRKAWLHVSYGPRDAFDLSLGPQAVAVGSDRSQCRIFAREAPARAASYIFESNQTFLIDGQGGRHTLQPGDTRRFGNVEITLCSEALPIGVGHTPPSQHSAPAATEGNAPSVVPLSSSSRSPSNWATPPISTTHQKVLWHLQGTSTIELPLSGNVSIGRTPGNDIVLNDPGISSRHATLTVNGTTLSVCDLGSTNGTFLNGHRLTPQRITPLNHGDTLTLARQDFAVRLTQ